MIKLAVARLKVKLYIRINAKLTVNVYLGEIEKILSMTLIMCYVKLFRYFTNMKNDA